MLGLSLSLTSSATRPNDTPPDLPPGDFWALYDPSLRASLFQDVAMTVPVLADGDPVGAMRDLSGNGRHLLQATAAARPIYRHAGNVSWLEGDGVDDMLTTPISLSAYPVLVASALQMLDGEEGGIVALHQGFSIYKALMQGGGGTYQLRATDRNAALVNAPVVADAAPHVALADFGAAATRISVDGGAVVSAGNSNGFGMPADLRLFSFRDADRWHGRIFALAIVSGPMREDIRLWLARKAGLTG